MLLYPQFHGATHHRGRQGGFIVLGRGLGYDFPAANHGYRIGYGADFAEFMRDENNGSTLLLQAAHNLYQLVGFLRGEHRGGFIQDQDFRVAKQRLDNFHALLGSHREVLDASIGIDVETETHRHLPYFFTCRVQVQHADSFRPLHGFETQSHGLRHGKDRDQHEVLVHHPDPRCHRIGGVLEVHYFPVDADFAFFGLVQAVEDIHQGGFTRTVFPQQGVDLPRFHHQVNVVIRHQGAETLGDAPQFQFHSCLSPTTSLSLRPHPPLRSGEPLGPPLRSGGCALFSLP